MTYDSSTALIVVDVQNDFADPDGSLYVPSGEEVVPYVNEQIAEALSAGARIVYSQDWHPPSTPHFVTEGGIWPVHCVKDTFGAEFHPDLDIVDEAIVIKKGTGGEDGYSAFSLRDPLTGETGSTGLSEQLEGIDRVVVVGLALDYCVKETALDAVKRFETILLADGTRAVGLKAGDGARAVAELVSAGVVVT